jgi:hypothetical protein
MSFCAESTDEGAIEAKVDAGDAKAEEVLSAMCYQIAKIVGTAAITLEGKVDALGFTGGLVNSKFATSRLRRWTGWLAPIYVFQEQNEMEALAARASRWADFIFVSDGRAMEAKAREAGLSSVPGDVVDCLGKREAAEKTVALVREVRADILLASDLRMGNVLHKAFTYVAKKRVVVAVMGSEGSHFESVI